jgi:uncharacterized low-complexity protein
MSKQSNRSPLSIVLGVAAVASLGAAGAAIADTGENIFAMDELTSGYLTAGGHLEGGCGADRDTGDSDEDGSVGDKKDGEGSCGEDKDGEGKCGEGKCGSS